VQVRLAGGAAAFTPFPFSFSPFPLFSPLLGALQRAKGKPMLRVPLLTGARVFVLASVADTDAVVDLLTPAVAAARCGDAAPGAKAGDPLSDAKQSLLVEDA